MYSTGGDGFAAAFERAGSAVAAAVAAQRALQAQAWPDTGELRVRMGMHTGEAHERDGDYFGPPVNRAARVLSAAFGGQILVSAATAGVAERASGFEHVDLGEHHVKGVVDPLRLFGVRADGLAWIDDVAVARHEVKGNLSRPLTEWVGSVSTLANRAADLPTRRLVTLTGTGGVGKTRTAVEVGWMLTDDLPDGIWFLDLAPIADPGVVVNAIASTMSIAPPGMTAIDALVDWLRGRRLLLIVDNCEHLVAAVAEIVGAVTARCDTVKVLATSREPLGLPGERVVTVPSLASSDAVELFVEPRPPTPHGSGVGWSGIRPCGQRWRGATSC